MFKHILVPSDGSVLSGIAVDAAISFGKLIGARLTALYAMDEAPHSAIGEYIPENAMSQEEFRDAETARARRIVSAIEEKAKAAGVPCDSACVASHAPYHAIIETANDKGCDLIFMASHGRRGVAGLVLGSETHKVLTHCAIPVMVFR
jgi:nucleotide-binding universal stress UspA family protein